jgi:hypothetical protein
MSFRLSKNVGLGCCSQEAVVFSPTDITLLYKIPRTFNHSLSASFASIRLAYHANPIAFYYLRSAVESADLQYSHFSGIGLKHAHQIAGYRKPGVISPAKPTKSAVA